MVDDDALITPGVNPICEYCGKWYVIPSCDCTLGQLDAMANRWVGAYMSPGARTLSYCGTEVLRLLNEHKRRQEGSNEHNIA